MCKLRIKNFQHYIHLDYDWLNTSDRERLLSISTVYAHLFEHSRAAHCVNDKCPSKNVHRYKLDLMEPDVINNSMFQLQLKKFITDVDYYNSLLSISFLACDACYHWGVEWIRTPNAYRVKDRAVNAISQISNRRY